MISLAERRGRSALGHYDLPPSSLTTTITTTNGRRQQSAPPISTTVQKTLSSSSLSPPSPLLPLLTCRKSPTTVALPDIITNRIQALDQVVAQLNDSIQDLVADDADWLEEHYGLGRRLGAVHNEHRALVDLILDQHAELQEWRQRFEQSAAMHDQQRHALDALELRSWTSPDQLQMTITSLERELHRLDPGRSMEVNEELLDQLGPVPRLIALRFQRQDDLLFVMRRRLAQMSLDQPLTECMDQFRSLRALLDELHRLRQQNDQLQLRERRFQQSSLLRRRPLHQCSVRLMQTLIIALQNELSAVHDVIAELDAGQHPLRDLLPKARMASEKDAIDVDVLYAELSGTRARSTSQIQYEIDSDAINNDQLDRIQTRSSLQQLASALQVADFVSDSASRTAHDALSHLEQNVDIMETTISEQQDLVRNLSERLHQQHVLNLKLTTIVQELQRRSDGPMVVPGQSIPGQPYHSKPHPYDVTERVQNDYQ